MAVTFSKWKTPIKEQDAEVRKGNFGEVCLGYSLEEGQIEAGRCLQCKTKPCVAGCPVKIDIPAFIKCVKEGDMAGAAEVMDKYTNLPAVCGRVCPQESQCEGLCTVGKMKDFEPVAIGKLERLVADWKYAQENMQSKVYEGEKKGKVAVVGSGPSSLTVAGDLAKMGYEVKIFEALHAAGGVLIYGIPEFRLPKKIVKMEIEAMQKLGVDIECNVVVGKTITMQEIMEEYDACYIAVGAGAPHFQGVPGTTLNGVYSASEYLTRINLMHGYEFPKFDTPAKKAKKVVVIGGGNVAMDVARTAKRLGATEVSIVYRRRKDDMTALPDEIGGAIAEGCTLVQLKAPSRIATNKRGEVQALWVKPQIAGQADKSGRPRPVDSSEPEEKIPCDIIISAIGQATDIRFFEEFGIPVFRGNIQAKKNSVVDNVLGTYAGGDCVTGPSTVINAVAAGKVAAANIDAYLGFNHEITVDVDIPTPIPNDHLPCGRVELKERFAKQRGNDFDEVEQGMSLEEAMQEASRCLRCDYHGFGSFRGGRDTKW